MEETIAAIATPPGEGAIGIVRMSGKECVKIMGRVFKRSKALTKVGMAPGRLYHGHVIDSKSGEAIDEVMAVFMKGPRSYTGEDVAEIYAHGGQVVLARVLLALLTAGARLAQPGEFTRRAFLNGRMDLAQAEAVLEVVQAKSEAALKWAEAKLAGQLSQRINEIKGRVAEVLAQLEAGIDFPEEELELMPFQEMDSSLKGEAAQIKGLIRTYDETRAFREGLDVVIVGKPNVGKSSLFNALLAQDRVITSPFPGTTRDFVEENICLDGILVKLTDTAGLGEKNPGPVEKEAAERAKRRLAEADLVLLVLDRSQPMAEQDKEIITLAKGKKTLLVLNKADLPASQSRQLSGGLAPRLNTPLESRQVAVSALKGSGLGELRKEMTALAGGRPADREGPVVTSLRHKEALRRAEKALNKARAGLRRGSPLELPALDIKEGLTALGEITGEVTSEEILDIIFSRFCIGK